MSLRPSKRGSVGSGRKTLWSPGKGGKPDGSAEYLKPEYHVAIKFPEAEPEEGEEKAEGPSHDVELARWIEKYLLEYGAEVDYDPSDNIMLVRAKNEMKPRGWESEEGVAPSDYVMQVLHIMRKIDTDVTEDEPKSVEDLMASVEEDGRCVLWTLKEHEVIDFTPVHDFTIRPDWGMFWRLLSPSGMLFGFDCGSKQDLITIGYYYGEEIVYYWAYMTIYQLWLFIGAIIGFYYEFKPKAHPKHEHFQPWMSLIIVLWNLFFIWHLTYSLEVMNDIFDAKLRLPDFDLGVRSGFEGEERVNPISGTKELFYPAHKRRPKIICSGLVTILGLGCAFGIMYISLNLNGYINPKSVLYLESMSGLSGPGQIFDKDGTVSWLGPTMFHCIFVLALNMTYSELQVALIEWENYRTQEQADRVLASRRFLFEALDCFLPIFYLSVMERDLKYLRQEIIALFTFDEIRRIGLETIVPLLLIQYPEIDESDKSEKTQARIQFEMFEKESFDDYLEMIVQTGYIILVPSAVPLAAFFAWFSNFFEIGSDSWRICNLERRPFPRRTNDGIGFWFTALLWMFYTCVISNIFTTMLYTNQLHKWFPVLFPICHGCPDES